MKKRDRRRIVSRPSILSKRFKPIPGVPHRVNASRLKVHPLIVVSDLRRGSLESLARYLRENGCIDDREIVLELRKLLTGRVSRTKFRLEIVDHPDAPANKGGRPRSSVRQFPKDRDLMMFESYWEGIQGGAKPYIVIQDIRHSEEIDQRTVTRGLNRVRAYFVKLTERLERFNHARSIGAMHQLALSKLRSKETDESSDS